MIPVDIIPKDRTMPRWKYKSLRHLVRKLWRDNDLEAQLHQSCIDWLVYGKGAVEIKWKDLEK